MSDAALRLLFLTPFAPRRDAVHGGGRAMAHLIAGLAAIHEVRLLCLRAENEPAVDSLLVDRCEEVAEFAAVPRRGLLGRLGKKGRSLAGVVRGVPSWASHCWSPSLAERFAATLREWQPQVVQFEYHVMGQYAEYGHPETTVQVLNQHEPGTAAASESFHASSGTDRLVPALDLIAWRRYEPRVIRSVDVVVTFTARDAEEIQKLAPDARVECIPLGTELPPEALNPKGSKPGGILFIGNFLHPPNIEAAKRLAREILPRVHRTNGDATLTLVGANPTVEIRRLAGSHVTVTGRVPSVAPYLRAAAVVALPLTRGGGMRVKSLEALAAGKATVATPLALEGIGVRDGVEVLVAESDDAFSSAISTLLEDPDLRESLGTAARSWAEAHLGWDAPVARYGALYDRLLQRSGSSV